MDKCNLPNVRIDCEGRITLDGLCMAHSILFDHWGCNGGYELYETKPREEARKVFKDWLIALTDDDIKRIKGQ